MTILQAFKQDIETAKEQIYSVLAKYGYVDAKPTFETIAAIQSENNDCYQDILLAMYGEEYDNYLNQANANGEGAERVLGGVASIFSVLNKPITTLNEAIGNIGGSSANSETLATMESSVVAIEEETSKYRTMSIIAIVICIVIVAIIILR